MITNRKAADILTTLEFGSGVAETDYLLESSRIKTSVFEDLLLDRVDLIPGTKGSGKTALYRIFVDFLPKELLEKRQVVIAHGVQQREDTVFLAFKEDFDKLTEAEFIDFWCVYLVSLVNEQFIRSDAYKPLLSDCKKEIDQFKTSYKKANIPEFDRKRTLKEILDWTLVIIRKLRPKVSWKPAEDIGQFELSLGEDLNQSDSKDDPDQAYMPIVITELVSNLEILLKKSNLSIWLMVDRLDELFARRSTTERKALRGLLSTIRLFNSEHLRDDMLEEIVEDDGFTALSHVVSRKSDTLRWSEDQILAMIVRRISANEKISELYSIEEEKIETSPKYQQEVFYKIFSDTVHPKGKQSSTLRWIYNHVKDGRKVITPRDVIFLLTRACQWQRDYFRSHSEGSTDRLITGQAILYALNELSREKKTIHLEAEFPHLWRNIDKLSGGGTQYSERAIKRIFGKKSNEIIKDLRSIGLLEVKKRKGETTYSIPFLYRYGLECTQKYIPK